MNKSDRPIRKFNPGTFQSDEEVIEQFAVGKHELDMVLGVLRGNIGSPSCQHVLVVAPRGRGKTMLLARVSAELNADEELFRCFLPVRFMEESHEIFDLADFWLETLFYVARESVGHDSALAQALREAHADLTDRWDEEALEDRARDTVLDAADRLGRKLVLMVENLQTLCEDVDDDFGWQLRGALESEPRIMLLATATSRFEGLEDAEEPFFELFRIIDLEPLGTEDCCRLWQVVSGDEVTEREIRPLEILTGGNPRLLVMVAEFAHHRSLRQLMEELVTLIDEHTEYFRSYLEALPRSERRVYLALIDFWRPSSTSEIAARARMGVRSVSTMLGRLVTRGAVVVEGTGRKRLYAAGEPLYSIYYKLRRERDEAIVMRSLIHFMMAFYGIGELYQMSGRLNLGAAIIREGIERALVEQPHVEDSFLRVAGSAIEYIPDRATANAPFSAELRLKEEIQSALDEKEFERVIEIGDHFIASGGVDASLMPESLVAYILHMRAIACEKLEDFQEVVAVCDEMVERFDDAGDQTLLARMARVLIHGARARYELGELDLTVSAYEDVIERFGSSDAPDFQFPVVLALLKQGDLQVQQGELDLAMSAYEDVIARFGTSDASGIQLMVALALSQKGDLQAQLGELDLAVSAYEDVIARFDTSDVPAIQVLVAWALSQKGMIQIKVGRMKEALLISEELEGRLGALADDEKVMFVWRARYVQALALLLRNRQRMAMDVFQSAYAVFLPDNETMMYEMLQLVPDLIANGAPERDLVGILLSRGKSDALEPLIVALRQRTGEVVRAPVEVLEVARDINRRIEFFRNV
ncbi:MAG: tetratricopeptide repeat protein [Gemmatimonadetes bacterium]|nr:tetratricopeptide repeat protein [Gemmatimonadota bacterium]